MVLKNCVWLGWLEPGPRILKGQQFDPCLGTRQGCGFDPLSEPVPGDSQLMFLSLPCSLSKINQ